MGNKDLDKLSKSELEQRMHEKNLQALKDEGGIGALLVYNLENFAYRYIETTQTSDIKCQFSGDDYWVSSIEPDVVSALKWDNPEVKKSLISLCKQYSGARSKEINIQLKLGSKVLDEGKVECYSMINWNFPNFEKVEGKYVEKTELISFDDPIVLRNTHAAFLEKVATIF